MLKDKKDNAVGWATGQFSTDLLKGMSMDEYVMAVNQDNEKEDRLEKLENRLQKLEASMCDCNKKTTKK